MAKVHFRTNVLIKSIIGKDLITDDNIAVLELVKNSFDANSKKVEIIFKNLENNDDNIVKKLPSKKTSKIIIRDTGIGMTEEDLIDKWLNIAYSEKKIKKQEFGRILAGNKGVGRFSCDRLGNYLDIYTRKKGSGIVHLFIDWKRFEVENRKDLDIQKIILETEYIKPAEFKAITGFDVFESGTIIEISKLREFWHRDKILSLKRQLEKLINPHQAFKRNSFEIEIIALEFKNSDKTKADYEKINTVVKNKIFEKLNFRTTSIHSSIDKEGKFITTKLQDRGKTIFTLVEKNTFNLLSNIQTSVYYLNPYSKAYFTKQTGIRSIDFGSISLFINGFRIPPYGDQGDDWLGLEIRKGQGHSRYLGTREIVGRIEINNNNDSFKIISSRSGVVNNAAYEQLTKSTSPFGFFYKIFRRLERFVVEGIKWDSVKDSEEDIEDKINSSKWRPTNEIYAEDSLSRNKRILSVINKIIDARKGDVVKLEINNDFTAEIINEQTEKAKEELNLLLDEISSKKLSSEDILDFLAKIDIKYKDLKIFANTIAGYTGSIENSDLKKYQKIQESYGKKQNELTNLLLKLKESEERERKLQEELELEKQKNTYFKATDRSISEDAKGLVHNIKITAKAINSNVQTLYEKIQGGTIKEKEILARLSIIKFNAEKALKISQLITRSNFRTQADKQYVDIAKFINQYLELYSEIYEENKVSFLVNNKTNSSFEKKISILDLSLIFDDLISNSEKAGAPKIQVDINTIKGKNLKILFSDSGRGMDKKLMNNIEQIFELGVTTTDGSGIGLHTVRKALKDMNATISFVGNGKVLKGATFEIIFNG